MSRIPASIAVGQAALIGACAVDLATAPGAAPPLVALIAVALGLGAAGGALAGAAAALLARAPRPAAPGPTAVALLLATLLWLGGHGALLVVVGGRFHDPQLMALLLVAAAFALLVPAAIVFLPVRRALIRLGRWPTLGAGAVLVALAGAVLLPGPREAVILAVAAAAGGAVGWAWRRRPPRLSRRAAAAWAAGSIALFAFALGPAGDDPGVARGRIVPAATAWLRPVLDRDGDGHLAVLGGADCAEGDAARAPEAIETAGDGIDQDCRFGDLQAPAAPPPAPAAPPLRAVVLLTLAGVDDRDELAARLPRLAARIDAGTRFAGGRELRGPLRRVAPVWWSGRLTGADEADGGGFAIDGAGLPQLAARAGWQVGVASTTDLSHLTTVFPLKRSRWKKDAAAAARSAVSLLAGERALVWVHLAVSKKNATEVDAALAELLAAVAARGAHRVLIVAGGPDKAARPRRGGRPGAGGPIALLGAGGASVVDAPVGSFDVYPTLLALTGIAEPEIPARPPAPGRALVTSELAEPTLAGWLGDRADHLVATDGTLAVRHDPGRRAFHVRAPSGSRWIGEDAAGGDAAPLVALLRDRHLAPHLHWRNVGRAAGMLGAVPDDLAGVTATIAGALEVLGCRWQADHDRVEVTLVLRGGEHLRHGDLVEVMLKSPAVRVFATAAPLGGALPFGSWPDGAIVAHRAVFERSMLGADEPTAWISVVRGGKRLAVTRGEGVSRNAVPICVVEP